MRGLRGLLYGTLVYTADYYCSFNIGHTIHFFFLSRAMQNYFRMSRCGHRQNKLYIPAPPTDPAYGGTLIASLIITSRAMHGNYNQPIVVAYLAKGFVAHNAGIEKVLPFHQFVVAQVAKSHICFFIFLQFGRVSAMACLSSFQILFGRDNWGLWIFFSR